MKCVGGRVMMIAPQRLIQIVRVRTIFHFLFFIFHFSFLLFLSHSPAASAQAAENWSTYRGNTQRTANTDNTAGPNAPKVLWSHKSQEHFVASLVPDGDKLYLSGIGAFNVANFHVLSSDPKAA